MSHTTRVVTPTPSSDVDTFLHEGGAGATVTVYQPRESVFSQGAAADSVMYLQDGTLKLSVSSRAGQEAIVALLHAGTFFGESALAGDTARRESATAMTAASVLSIPKAQMIQLLREQHAFSDRFIAHTLARNMRLEEDVVDQLFNSCEKRLGRALLLLAQAGKPSSGSRVVPVLSQQTLAEMVGTTRSRVNFFMKKFKGLGYIESRGGLRVNDSLAAVILHDERGGMRP